MFWSDYDCPVCEANDVIEIGVTSGELREIRQHCGCPLTDAEIDPLYEQTLAAQAEGNG